MIQCAPNISYDSDVTLLDSMTCGIPRHIGESVVLSIVYLMLTLISSVTNGSVILLGILERWRELDSFTFVFASSLSFNQLFISFFIYPVISYSIIARMWDLQNLWCWFCALISSYLYTVYALHIVILLLDMAVVKYSNTRTLISVSVSKKIALTTWMVSLGPQLYPLLFSSRSSNFRYDPVQGGCFQTFLFRSISSVFLCIGIYVVLPLIVIAVRYMQLLFNEDDRRNLAATISRIFEQPTVGVRQYSTSICLGVMAAVTTLPWFVFEMVKMAADLDASTGRYRTLSHFTSTWLCFSSILVPVIYLITCPTYFRKIFPRNRFKFLYKLGLGQDIRKSISSVVGGTESALLHNAINPIREEVYVREDDDDDYIELPAVTITISEPHNHRKSKRTKSVNGSHGDIMPSPDHSIEQLPAGITYENGHAVANRSPASVKSSKSVLQGSQKSETSSARTSSTTQIVSLA